MAGVRVNSRAELEALFRDDPRHLTAARMSRPPHYNHPDFIGPVQPEARIRAGALRFDEDGGAFFVLKKEPWERARCEAYERMEAERERRG